MCSYLSPRAMAKLFSLLCLISRNFDKISRWHTTTEKDEFTSTLNPSAIKIE